MNKQAYFETLSKFPLPTEVETKEFLRQFTLAHSWYKHLSWSEPTDFVFFLDASTGKWNYLMLQRRFNWNPSTEENLPDELLEMCTFQVTAFIHGSFGHAENENFQENHFKLKNDLLGFLIDLAAKIKNGLS